MSFIILKYTTLLACHKPKLERIRITLIIWKVIAWQEITISLQFFCFSWKHQSEFKTSIINFKHWLTLLRVNCKHWPWSLLRCEDFLSLYIIFYNVRKVGRVRLTGDFSTLLFSWVKCVELRLTCKCSEITHYSHEKPS